MKTLVGCLALITITSASAEITVLSPPFGSWANVTKVCQMTGETKCADRAAGGFEMLMLTHQICPSRILTPREVWAMLDDYYGRTPDRDLPKERQSISGLVLDAATALYPCPPTGK